MKTASFSMPRDLCDTISRLAFHGMLSKSSIVEIALREYLDGRTDQELLEKLRSRGASLRRTKHLDAPHNGIP